MAGQYFYAKGDKQHGPHSADKMRELALSGEILPTDLIWQEGMTQRFPASVVQNLFAPAEDDAVAPAASDEGAVVAADAPPEQKPAESYAVPASEKAVKPPEKERPKRVITIKGGVLCSQDGKYVQYRRKCPVCGDEAQGRSTQLIKPGSMKIPFFCRKCRKGRTTEMQGIA